MELKPLYTKIVNKLEEAGIAAADQEARMILETRLGLSWTDLIARPDMKLAEQGVQDVQKDLAQRLSAIPLGRIYGKKHFYNLEFELSAETLEPRNDTEILIDVALKTWKSSPETILDLGTGTGCILITLLHEWTESKGTGVDISENALKTARKNAEHHNVDARAEWICGSWADGLEKKFDLIVSNPPYIESDLIPDLDDEVKNHDPIQALDGGKDGLNAYRKIFSQLPQILKPEGIALFEIGYDQSYKVTRLAENSGLNVKHVHPDIAGRARVVELCINREMGIK